MALLFGILEISRAYKMPKGLAGLEPMLDPYTGMLPSQLCHKYYEQSIVNNSVDAWLSEVVVGCDRGDKITHVNIARGKQQRYKLLPKQQQRG